MILNESSGTKGTITVKNDLVSIAEDVLMREIPRYVPTFQLLRDPKDDKVFKFSTTRPLNHNMKLGIELIQVVKSIDWT